MRLMLPYISGTVIDPSHPMTAYLQAWAEGASVSQQAFTSLMCTLAEYEEVNQPCKHCERYAATKKATRK